MEEEEATIMEEVVDVSESLANVRDTENALLCQRRWSYNLMLLLS